MFIQCFAKRQKENSFSVTCCSSEVDEGDGASSRRQVLFGSFLERQKGTREKKTNIGWHELQTRVNKIGKLQI